MLLEAVEDPEDRRLPAQAAAVAAEERHQADRQRREQIPVAGDDGRAAQAGGLGRGQRPGHAAGVLAARDQGAAASTAPKPMWAERQKRHLEGPAEDQVRHDAHQQEGLQHARAAQ